MQCVGGCPNLREGGDPSWQSSRSWSEHGRTSGVPQGVGTAVQRWWWIAQHAGGYKTRTRRVCYDAILSSRVDPAPATAENAGVDEIVARLRTLGFATERTGTEIHVVTVGVLLIISEHRERFTVRIASNDQVTRICFDVKEVVAEVLNWRRLR
jgi:hypothetical protein